VYTGRDQSTYFYCLLCGLQATIATFGIHTRKMDAGGRCDRYSRMVIRVDGPFMRAGGFELAIQHGVSTKGADRDRSLLFFMDTDMFLHPGVINAAVNNTVKDEVCFMLCFSVLAGSTFLWLQVRHFGVSLFNPAKHFRPCMLPSCFARSH
jgi:hypothetical protein